MKAILISIRPEWVEKIASGEKTIEVRKTAPKETPFKAYIYCTKDKYEWLYRVDNNGYGKAQSWHGKVVGEFICDKVDKYTFSYYEGEYRVNHLEQKAMCLNHPELIRYGVGKILCGWHISDLKIYDKPKELSKFRKPLDSVYCSYFKDYCEEGCVGFGSTDYVCNDYWEWEKGLTRPPQSWCYVEER